MIDGTVSSPCYGVSRNELSAVPEYKSFFTVRRKGLEVKLPLQRMRCMLTAAARYMTTPWLPFKPDARTSSNAFATKIIWRLCVFIY